jgi:putative ABC transport system permease protein
VLFLLALEGALVTLVGVVAGWLTCLLVVALLGEWFGFRFGIALHAHLPSVEEGLLLITVLVVGWLASPLPGVRAYRLSLVDGPPPRI